jgi:hypothetical protein
MSVAAEPSVASLFEVIPNGTGLNDCCVVLMGKPACFLTGESINITLSNGAVITAFINSSGKGFISYPQTPDSSGSIRSAYISLIPMISRDLSGFEDVNQVFQIQGIRNIIENYLNKVLPTSNIVSSAHLYYCSSSTTTYTPVGSIVSSSSSVRYGDDEVSKIELVPEDL